jgi:hypothetical protein
VSGVRRRRTWLVVVLCLSTRAVACGDDGPEEAGDEDSFCRLARTAAPVSEADLETLTRLEELAPLGVRDEVVVLVDLATQVDEAGATSADALAIEFEIRFSDEYIAARRAVDDFVGSECPRSVARVTTTSTTSATSATSTSTSEGSTTTSTTSRSTTGEADATDETGETDG